ncbi:hypothetical protein [Polaribacter butkevichii]|uniref:Adhesin domain-containing protein n=1 Tax=Polaribacter butkevichii TaxID=218490 RepID=A0A2P6C8B2_9FLAO|nr:hypothetical protein [Polaribacter butkevichii]PQJ69163.1 hypothetical protein BTO14_14140 [Polaribacter butkevichii]
MFVVARSKVFVFFLLISSVVLSQKKVLKKFETQSKEIEISTLGLDDLVIENSTSNFVEVYLIAENVADQQIVSKEAYGLLKIQFKIPENITEEKVFRKFITERLHRASVVIKIPKNKKITIFGDEINIETKSYQGDLNIYIEKGILKLHTIYASLRVKMYAGNLYAAVNKANIDIVSKKGKIKINDVIVENLHQKKEEKSDEMISINSIKANIFLTTQ